MIKKVVKQHTQEVRVFTPHDVMAIHEENRAFMRVLGEDIKGIHDKLDGQEQRLDGIDKRLDRLDMRLNRMEADIKILKADMGVVKAELGVVKDMLTYKAEKKEHARLVARVQALEARMAH